MRLPFRAAAGRARPRRRRASRLPRLDPQRTLASPIAGQVWTRASLKRPQQLAAWRRWRALVGGVALLEAGLLAWLVAGPAFQVHRVEVSGTHHLTQGQVISAAGLAGPRSIFAVDAAAASRRLAASPWVRGSVVSAQLPDRVLVSVDEWAPVAVYRAGEGGYFFMSAQAVALGAAPDAQGLLEIQGTGQPEARAGRHVMDVQLLTALVNVFRSFPGQYGQQVVRFETDCTGSVTLVTRRGWKAYFGRVITPEEYDALQLKLGALKAVQAREDFNSPDLEYINVMDASLPAVKHRSTPAPAAPPKPAPAPNSGPVVIPCR